MTSQGAVPYLEAILSEELAQKAPEDDIRMTRDAISMARIVK
jgi:hypothetical protein